MNIIFMGTPPFAVTALDALKSAGHKIVAVYTQPPRPANRGQLTPTAVHQYAEEHSLPTLTPTSLRTDEALAEFQSFNADVAVVAAYGLILPQPILDTPLHGCINIHASLLPRWRGAAPVQRAIMAGDTHTGVAIMQMERGLDTGPVLMEEKLPIERQTTGELTEELADLGGRLIVDALSNIKELTPKPQPEDGVTYAHKIDKAEARIDWTASATEIDRLVRAMQPSPGAWFEDDGGRVKLIAAEPAEGSGQPGAILPDARAACGTGALMLVTVQPQGKKPMPAEDWFRGRRSDAPLA